MCAAHKLMVIGRTSIGLKVWHDSGEFEVDEDAGGSAILVSPDTYSNLQDTMQSGN